MLGFLWQVLAWGAGTGARNNRRRLSSVAADLPGAVEALRGACALAGNDPEAAYARMLSGRRQPVIGGFGPAFFTKVLYFAGHGVADHPCLILDDRVAGALRDRCGWDSLRTGGGWPVVTYGRYCDLLSRWAGELTQDVNRDVAGDELERWLFDQGAARD